MKKLLVINPGSTSTKIAVYEDDKAKWVESITHSLDELKKYKTVYDQFDMRTELIKKSLEEHGDELDSFDAIVSRGGNMPPVSAGAYEVNDYMVDCLHYRPGDQHASNVGAGIAKELADSVGIKAYTYDAITVDEMDEITKICGLKGIRRPARGHNLNTRAAALKLCRDKGLDYKNVNIIVAHLGGGVTVNLHSKGRISDFISDCEGPFSPERAGGVPTYEIVKMCYSGEFTYEEMMKNLQRKGGMISYFGTADMREIEKLCAEGNKEAQLVFDAMALDVAKNIAKISATVCGKVDYIVLTGGLAYSKAFTDKVAERVSFIAPVDLIPGENEMQSLAEGVLRVLNGEETAKLLEEK